MSDQEKLPGRSWIRSRFSFLTRWTDHPAIVPVILLFLSIACYGLLIDRLGYYWDDFPLNYIKNIYGSAGLTRYFSTNRPFWAWLYQLTFSLFSQAWQWQMNALIWRWMSAVFVWLIIREAWPGKKILATWVSILFLVYPGFTQQHISVIYGNLFFVLDCYLLSLYLSLRAIHLSGDLARAWMTWLLHGAALLLSLYNLLALEYFFALELLRPLLFWAAAGEVESSRNPKTRRTLISWLPYLLLWLGVTIWRVFFFSFQTQNYQMVLFKSFRENSLQAIFDLLKSIGSSLWVVIIQAWAKVLVIPDVSQLGLRTSIVMVAIVLIIAIFLILYLRITGTNQESRKGIGFILLTGFITCLLGGIPWWLTGLHPGLIFPSDRFTLPFILGVSLLLATLIYLLPVQLWLKSIFLGILISLAVGSQFQVVNQFRRDWETQRRFFWQLAWRIPALEPGTTLMVSDLPVTYFSDNSLTAPLNWFWASQNTTQEMSYLLQYPSQRLGKSLASMNPGVAITVDYLVSKFHGNTSQVVAISYDPPACVRVLDRALDSDNRMLPMDMQAAAALSSAQWIQLDGKTAAEILPANLYGSELSHGWCYYFELADLARQQGDWDTVASLGDAAFALNDYPNDPTERFPFIEAYAHVGKWDSAMELTRQSLAVTPLMQPLLCRLWQRIHSAVPDSQDNRNAYTTIKNQLSCVP